MRYTTILWAAVQAIFLEDRVSISSFYLRTRLSDCRSRSNVRVFDRWSSNLGPRLCGRPGRCREVGKRISMQKSSPITFPSHRPLMEVCSIVAVAVPLSRRSVVYGFSGAVYGVSSVIAPLLGGAFTTKLTWRWCFFINLPCGGLTFLVVLVFFQMPRESGEKSEQQKRWLSKLQSLDFTGVFFFMPSVVCLLLALQWGGSTYAWSDARIIALWIVFGFLFLAFLMVEWRRPSKAMLPFRLLKNRTIISCAAYNFCLGGSASVMEYYVSFAVFPTSLVCSLF